MSGRIEARLADQGITLPEAPSPLADYVPWVITGNLLFISGQLPVENGVLIRGQLSAADHAAGRPPVAVAGSDLARACDAARLCGLALLAHTKAALGELDRVTRVVKLVGFVNGQPDFEQAPIVINACSALMKEAFAEAGQHARTAVTIANLPFGGAVEVEAVIEFR